MRLVGHFVYAYFWARMAKIAIDKQAEGDFYYAKLLPETATFLKQIRAGSDPLMAMDVALF